MNTNSTNNNGNLLMYNLLSNSVKRCLEMYRNNTVSDAMKSQPFWLKIAKLDAVLKSVTGSYPTVTVSEDKSVYFYHGFKFFVVHIITSTLFFIEISSCRLNSLAGTILVAPISFKNFAPY